MTNKSDSDLVRACLGGVTSAFESLVDRYQATLYNVALKMVNDTDDAKDIAQAAFVKAFENLEKFDLNRKFFSGLYRIAVNESIDHLKRTKRHVPIETDAVAVEKTPAERYEENELGGIIQDSIWELDIDYRAAIVLRHFADLSLRELSFVLEIPEKTVKSRLYTARRLLCRALKRRGVVSYE